jgi:hypothetical protein
MAVEIVQIDTQDLTTQLYESQDTNLISTFDVNTSLSSGSYIEYFIYDLNQNLLSTDYNFTQYSVLNDGQSAGSDGVLSQIIINPEQNLINNGFTQGTYVSYYNFLNHQIGSDIEQLYISEISSDRTEIRLDSTTLSNQDIVEKTNAFIQQREDSTYFLDFYLNFGDNILFIANNIALDNQDPNNPTILIKLYEPLPEDFLINSTLWIVSSVEEPIAYQVSFIEEPIIFNDTLRIKGPNFNINLKDQVNNSTQELSYTDLVTTSLTSSQNQLSSLLEEKEIDINIDYTTFEDYIHFSSAQTRLENFYYKVSLLEQYSSSLAILNSTNSSSIAVSESSAVLESKINNIITNFDGWDYYLYYTSGSWAWPKTNTEPPYQLATTGSVDVLNWFGSTNEYSPSYGGIILSASLFDENNKDNLLFSIPEYLREDPNNEPYELFIDMVAQHFDNIWIYYKDVTQKYNSDNRLEYGISKDIVSDAIRDFGIKLYQNSFSNNDLYTAFLGLTPEGGLFPFPNITGSLPTPSGFEYIDTLVSASNDYIPLDDVNKSLYKRIYHNLPYLLKSKGTLPGLRALITSYGIPDTILRINEYGGKDKVDSNDWDYWQNEFNYAYSTEDNNFISSSWTLNGDWYSPDDVPSTLAFRFQTPGISNGAIRYSQSLWSNEEGSAITLRYTGSAFTSGSYSGSIIDPYYQYANLDFYPDITNPTVTASVYLPFFDKGWWSVMVNRSGSTFTLSAANKIYEGGNNGTILGFYNTSSITGNATPWTASIYSYFPISFSSANIFGYDVVTYDNTAIYDGTGSLAGLYVPFSGSYQEIRYYNSIISSSVFKDYTMNPYSIEGNSLNSAPNELAFRASIGGEFYTASVSIHPKVTGSWVVTQSFPTDSNFYYDLTPIFKPNTEYIFFDQPIAGIKNAVSDKIRLENDNLPSGSVLSPFRRLAQTTEASASYTPNINLLEVAFSPQDEINDDINSSIGYFNIGNFIGDPAFRSSRLTSYPNLDKLRNEYFEKYTKNYNLNDFIRLIKFFDNSLFKMIKDFVPARTSLASGIVIKQTLLERNRYPEPQASWSNLDISGTIKPQWNDYNEGTVEHFDGGTAGMFEPFNYVSNTSQSWNETYQTTSGSITVLHDSQDEFYNGEFSGSIIIVTTQSLNQPYPLSLSEFEYTPIVYRNGLYGKTNNSTFTRDQFLNTSTQPQSGEMLILIPNFRATIFPTLTIRRGLAYIKISKFDCNGNDNSIPLGQITNLLIKYTSNSTYTNYHVLNISEFSTYYLYRIDNQDISLTGAGMDNEVKNYYTSASKTSPQTISTPLIGTYPIISSYQNELGDFLNYFNTSSGVYNLNNTPNIGLSITASLTNPGNGTIGTGNAYIEVLRDGVRTPLSSIIGFTTTGGSPTTVYLSSSYYGLKGDQLYLRATTSGVLPGNNYTITNAQFLITQSITPTASVCDSVIFEPYITTANFYNSDENAIMNNVFEDRISTTFQDVDYSSGVLVPTNFDLIIEGDAQRAAVQDSNYTLLRHTNPRYNGSKSTSQKLNQWTLGDNGTYGKLPTVDSTKVWVAYAETIGGYTPDRMDCSGIIVKYLIDQDGNVAIPNTTENSLSNIQGTFQTGERLIINTNSIGSGENSYRTIFKGGYRIEPILYTQIGHTPPNWTSSINLYNSEIIQTITDNTCVSTLNTYSSINTGQSIFYTEHYIGQYPGFSPSSSAGWSIIYDPGNNRFIDWQYNVDNDTIIEGVNLIINAQIGLARYGSNPTPTTVQINLYKNNGGDIISTKFETLTPGQKKAVPFYIELTPDIDFISTDEFYFGVFQIDGPEETDGFGTNLQVTSVNPSTYFNISQNPLPNPSQLIPVGTSSIWDYPTSNTYNQQSSSQAGIIYIPEITSSLNFYYGLPGIRQQDVSGSGFEDITLDWSIEVGDEFRFEGKENRTYTVKKVFTPTNQSPERISNTGSLEIHLNSALPSASINLDHFLIRRYVDDAATIIFEGLKPGNSPGPYIIRPEFVVPALNKDLDSFIVDLTQKGLL